MKVVLQHCNQRDFLVLSLLFWGWFSFSPVDAITCYKCESYRDYRCLDPFDFQPHVQVNCDFEPFVRDKKPVFCEKTTDLIDGVYVTTRGCSNFHWEDIESFIDHKNQPIRCFRKGLLERCFCQYDGCNPAAPTPMLNPLLHLIPWLTVFVSFPVYHSI